MAKAAGLYLLCLFVFILFKAVELNGLERVLEVLGVFFGVLLTAVSVIVVLEAIAER